MTRAAGRAFGAQGAGGRTGRRAVLSICTMCPLWMPAWQRKGLFCHAFCLSYVPGPLACRGCCHVLLLRRIGHLARAPAADRSCARQLRWINCSFVGRLLAPNRASHLLFLCPSLHVVCGIRPAGAGTTWHQPAAAATRPASLPAWQQQALAAGGVLLCVCGLASNCRA